MSLLRFQFSQDGKLKADRGSKILPFTALMADSIKSEYSRRYESIIELINEAGGFARIIMDYKGEIKTIEFPNLPESLLEKIAELDKKHNQATPNAE